MVECNVVNRTLFCADNLGVLRGINSNSIHLIATDPPFCTGKDWGEFDDRWGSGTDTGHGVVDKVIDAARHSYGDDMGAFLCFLGVRLIEMHRILRDDGSIYLHCDPTASHYIKAMMDAIWGRKQFRNEVVWDRASGRGDGKQYGRVHDVILFYSKGKKYTWNRVYVPHSVEHIAKHYKHEDTRGRWGATSLTAAGVRFGESGAVWRGVDPNRSNRHWATPTQSGMNDYIVAHNIIPGWPHLYPNVHSRLDALDAAGLIYWPERGETPMLKYYLEASHGAAVRDIFSDIGKLEGNEKEKTGYPTQKPLALYERIIKASSNEGDIVLDPFCGSGTTLVAAERLGRRWIGIDTGEKAIKLALERTRDSRQLFSVEGVPCVTTGMPILEG